MFLLSRWFLQLSMSILFILPVYVVHAHEVQLDIQATAGTNPQRLVQIINEKIDYYNETYPDIRFVHIDGGKDWHGDLVTILTILGDKPDALDYQHPPQLSKMLLDVSIQRLKAMLELDIVSATLFRVGQDSVINRANVCIITLNPDVFVANDYQATQYMLDVSDEEMKNIHPARYLDHEHHLEFTLDHEAFHCLDSYFNGGSPQTKLELGGEYNLFRRESVADAYAMAKHIKRHQDHTPYARNIIHARALWLFSDSPNRCTFETIRDLLNYDHEALRKTPEKQLIGLATHIRNKTVGNYDAYVVQRAAAIHAAQSIGIDIRYYGEQWAELSETASNQALIQHLVNRYQFYYEMLYNDEPIPIEAPPKHDWIHKYKREDSGPE